MSNNLETRLKKLERGTIMPSKLIRRFGDQCGPNGEITWQETAEEAQTRYILMHGDDSNTRYDFLDTTFVHGKWSDKGELICNEKLCPNFNKVIKTNN